VLCRAKGCTVPYALCYDHLSLSIIFLFPVVFVSVPPPPIRASAPQGARGASLSGSQRDGSRRLPVGSWCPRAAGPVTPETQYNEVVVGKFAQKVGRGNVFMASGPLPPSHCPPNPNPNGFGTPNFQRKLSFPPFSILFFSPFVANPSTQTRRPTCPLPHLPTCPEDLVIPGSGVSGGKGRVAVEGVDGVD